MAFATNEKFTIIRLLGWPAGTIISGNLNFSNIIASRLENLTAEVEEQVRTLFGRLDTLDAHLQTAISRAGVKQIDDIQLRDNEIEILRKERNLVIKELSQMLDIPKMSGSSSMGCVTV